MQKLRRSSSRMPWRWGVGGVGGVKRLSRVLQLVWCDAEVAVGCLGGGEGGMCGRCSGRLGWGDREALGRGGGGRGGVRGWTEKLWCRSCSCMRWTGRRRPGAYCGADELSALKAGEA